MVVNPKNKLIQKRGFTLVELLVVISIIGILSTFAMVSLNTARAKARDALRKGEMAQLRTALNMYYDNNLQYPACAAAEAEGWDPADPDYGVDPVTSAQCYNDLETELVGGADTLIDKLPYDPKNPTNSTAVMPPFNYRYISHNNGEECVLIYFLEDDPLTPAYIKSY